MLASIQNMHCFTDWPDLLFLFSGDLTRIDRDAGTIVGQRSQQEQIGHQLSKASKASSEFESSYGTSLGHFPRHQEWFLGGLRGRSPLVKISAHFGGFSPPKTPSLAWLFRIYWPCFQSSMINCALLYGYWGISYCWHISVKLNYHVSIFGNMGAVAAGPHPNYGRGCA